MATAIVKIDGISDYEYTRNVAGMGPEESRAWAMYRACAGETQSTFWECETLHETGEALAGKGPYPAAPVDDDWSAADDIDVALFRMHIASTLGNRF